MAPPSVGSELAAKRRWGMGATKILTGDIDEVGGSMVNGAPTGDGEQRRCEATASGDV